MCFFWRLKYEQITAMVNPVIAEVTRGGRVESIHRGTVAVVDASGKIILARGDIEGMTFPRSSLKILQALPLVESGAADALGFTNKHLAVACASHSSSAVHVNVVGDMLSRAGLGPTDLQCGAHWPVFSTADAVAMAQNGETPTRIHNNCSGKHAGFLCTCTYAGISTNNYIDPSNELQREVRAMIGDLCGAVIGEDACGADGCSAPTFAVPIVGMAHAHARLATGLGLSAQRADAAKRLLSASMREPQMIADHGRYCTRLMQAAPERLYAKTGAEGFYAAALPQLGLGIAVKCDDGATRAAEVTVAATLAHLIGQSDPAYEAIRAMSRQNVRDWNKNVVGEVRAV